jgi:hypothetical protein
MFERSHQVSKSSQIQDPEEVNFAFLNAPYRLLSGSETSNNIESADSSGSRRNTARLKADSICPMHECSKTRSASARANTFKRSS